MDHGERGTRKNWTGRKSRTADLFHQKSGQVAKGLDCRHRTTEVTRENEWNGSLSLCHSLGDGSLSSQSPITHLLTCLTSLDIQSVHLAPLSLPVLKNNFPSFHSTNDQNTGQLLFCKKQMSRKREREISTLMKSTQFVWRREDLRMIQREWKMIFEIREKKRGKVWTFV